MTTFQPSWATLGLAGAALVLVAVAGCGVHEDSSSSHFTIEGAHQDLSCSACHGEDFEESPATSCTGCHQGDRPTAHWDDECNECHGQWRWDDLEYEHDEWPLTGAHVDTYCWDCHPQDFDAEDDCEDCHDEDRPSGHIGSGCDECHDTVSWHPPTWDHPGFALEGGHGGLGCTQCHVNGFGDLSSSCTSCHAGDAPNDHPDLECSQCHTIWDWDDVTFDHGFFPLQGGHDDLSCNACHANGYTNTPDRCHDCHNGPNGHYQTNCEQCHDIYEWD